MTFGKQTSKGSLNIIPCIARKGPRSDRHQQLREWSKKFIQQGRSFFDARSVLSVREHAKKARTPLAAFFNIPSRSFIWSLVWCGLIINATIFPTHACTLDPSFDKLLSPEEEAVGVSRMMKNLEQSTIHQRTFHETYYSGMLITPSYKEGTLIFHPPARLEKRVNVPAEESFIADGDQLLYENPSRGISHTFSLQDYPSLAALIEGLRSLFNGDEKTLRQVFDVSMAGTPNKWQLTLSPKTQTEVENEEEEDGVECIRLTGDSTHLHTIAILEINGDHSTLQLDPQVP